LAGFKSLRCRRCFAAFGFMALASGAVALGGDGDVPMERPRNAEKLEPETLSSFQR